MKSVFRIYEDEGELQGALQSSTVKDVGTMEKSRANFPRCFKEGKAIWDV